MLNRSIRNIGRVHPAGSCKCSIGYYDERGTDGIGFEEYVVTSYETPVMRISVEHALDEMGIPYEVYTANIRHDYLLNRDYRTATTTAHITLSWMYIFGAARKERPRIADLRECAETGELYVQPVEESQEFYVEVYAVDYI